MSGSNHTPLPKTAISTLYCDILEPPWSPVGLHYQAGEANCYTLLTRRHIIYIYIYMYILHDCSLPRSRHGYVDNDILFVDQMKSEAFRLNAKETPYHRLVSTANSIRVYGVNVWNSICKDIRNIKSLKLFRTSINIVVCSGSALYTTRALYILTIKSITISIYTTMIAYKAVRKILQSKYHAVKHGWTQDI